MNEFEKNDNKNIGSYGGQYYGGNPDSGAPRQNEQQFGYQNYSYTNRAYSQQGQNEYSYRPVKKKKKGRKVLNAILAILCVAAVGASSIVGYSLLIDRKPIANGSDSSNSIAQNDSSSRNNEKVSNRDMSNLPSIEELATPSDAMSIPDIVTKLSPSVVGISAIVGTDQYSGTGIIMSEDGYIITNAHVVEGASAISVVITDKTSGSTEENDDSSSKTVAEKILENQNSGSYEDDNSIAAELIGMDVQTDIAVLKIDKTGLSPAEFGTSDEILVGELAIVIGNPLGFDLANTVTSGIISATDRTLTIEDRTMNLIQTDASINSGNSGGPLINAYGQVIGITSAKVSSTYGEGLGFAIPISEAKEIVNDLIQYGYVKGRPTLGISGNNISSFYAQYYEVPQGFIVVSVESGSAAEKAGIQVNDIIVGIQGELISSIEEFNEIKSQYKAGDKISVSIYRGDNIIDLDVILDEAADPLASQGRGGSGGYPGYDDYDNYNYDDFRDFYDYYGQDFR